MNINVTFNNISIDDPDRDRRIIINNFMKELCELDNNAIINGKSNIFTMEEILIVVRLPNLKKLYYCLEQVHQYLRLMIN